MKLIKTKLAASLIFGAVMFGMFSFTTTRIAAQDTLSTVSAPTTEDEKRVAQVVEKAVGYVVAAAVVAVIYLARDCFSAFESDYPTDALD